ncbi:MAG: hypothetical protein ABR591_10925 [Candidatus Velthaea sp.]
MTGVERDRRPYVDFFDGRRGEGTADEQPHLIDKAAAIEGVMKLGACQYEPADAMRLQPLAANPRQLRVERAREQRACDGQRRRYIAAVRASARARV